MAGDRKRRHITIRVPNEDYVAVRNHAIARGLEVGPMVESWIRPIIEAVQGRPAQTAIAGSDDVAG